MIAPEVGIQATDIVFSEVALGEQRVDPVLTPRTTGVTSDLAGLNERQRKLLEILASRRSITNREYTNLVGISVRTGNRDLGELIARGLLEQIGRRRAAVYRLFV